MLGHDGRETGEWISDYDWHFKLRYCVYRFILGPFLARWHGMCIFGEGGNYAATGVAGVAWVKPGSRQAFSGDDLVPLRFQHMFSTESHVAPKESGALAGMVVWLSAACKVPFSRLPKKVSQDCDGEQPLQIDRTD